MTNIKGTRVVVRKIQGVASVIRDASFEIAFKSPNQEAQTDYEIALPLEQAISIFKQLGRLRAIKDAVGGWPFNQ